MHKEVNRPLLMEKVNMLEEKYPVHEWTVGDIRVWPIIRISLLHSLFGTRAKSKISNQSSNRTGFIASLQRRIGEMPVFITGLLRLFQITKRFRSKVDLFFVSYVTHRQEVGGIYYNRFCDSFIDYGLQHKLNSVLLEFKHPQKQHKNPVSHESVVYKADQAVNAYMKLRKLGSLFSRMSYQSYLPSYDDFLKEIELLFGPVLANKLSERAITTKARNINAASVFFDSLFSKQKPKVAFCVCYYTSDIDFGLQVSAYRNRIPVIDIQHGIQGPYHAAYGSWSKVPVEGYNLLPKYFWNWDIQSSEEIIKWSQRTSYHSSIHGGNPWLHLWEKKQFSKSYNFHSIFDNPEKKKVVLFSMQPVQNTFPDMIKQLIRETKEKCIWLLRVHPTQMDAYIDICSEAEKLGTDNINIREATQLPLPLILMHTDVHVTLYSTVAIEAMNYHVPTFFISELGKFYYNFLPDNLAFFDITTAEVFKEKLEEVANLAVQKCESLSAAFESAFEALLNTSHAALVDSSV